MFWSSGIYQQSTIQDFLIMCFDNLSQCGVWANLNHCKWNNHTQQHGINLTYFTSLPNNYNITRRTDLIHGRLMIKINIWSQMKKEKKSPFNICFHGPFIDTLTGWERWNSSAFNRMLMAIISMLNWAAGWRWQLPVASHGIGPECNVLAAAAVLVQYLSLCVKKQHRPEGGKQSH